EVSTMRFRSVGRVYMLATMVALAGLNTISQRIALAQIPEAPGTFEDSNGNVERSVPRDLGPWRKRAKPQSNEPAPPTPDPARDTIDVFERSRARGSGTPEPEPTRRGGFSGTE